MQGINNEWADFLSRHAAFEERIGEKVNDLAVQAFKETDEDLDLVLIP